MYRHHDFVQIRFDVFQIRLCKSKESHVLLECKLIWGPIHWHQPEYKIGKVRSCPKKYRYFLVSVTERCDSCQIKLETHLVKKNQ